MRWFIMKSKICFILFIFVLIALQGKELSQEYLKPQSISLETWNAAKPYFFPSNHPLKKKLDLIFHSTRATASSKALKEAFFKIEQDKEQDLIVAKHPLLKGYVIKLYYDDYKLPNLSGVPGDAQYWINRVIGAERVRKSIQNRHLEDLFTVPRKWLYPLPDVPKTDQPYPKQFILVSEDMDLVSHKKNEEMYRTVMTLRQLEGLYFIMRDAHLWDSIWIDNNIYTQDGKIAFIDTEEFDTRAIEFDKMTSAFSFEMQSVWIKLLKEQGVVIPAVR